ncbi:ATP-binding protein [Actinacidiphila glaucinigra]|uniref:ATP-binding protein n=1 Tax=Actinacidiphila glaucinigra TaxID=235986 RepID=UPI000B789AC0|nr:ATP-binding protein [Actinacidiphila glaucinigra]MDX2849939.1 ATP-binding protein [Streptomyces sp. PA03-3a]WSD65391.1 ATP-binding protein [Actinacidiphila glaucinigra]
MLRRSAFRLPRHPTSVGLARHRVRDHLEGWEQEGETVESVVLVVSELATNAVRYSPLLEREFEVAVTVHSDGSCVVEVSDGGAQSRPVPRDAGDGDESGRGLRLVQALSDTWGVRERGRYGKTVWAVLAEPAVG